MAFSPLPLINQLALPRLVLLLNHIVASEPVAMAKLRPHAGRTVDLKWVLDLSPGLGSLVDKLAGSQPPAPWRFVITPAGLFELLEGPAAAEASTGGLNITVHLPDPLAFARLALKGERPEVKIEGDAALAEVAAWMMKNLRWDVQDDIARWMGTAPAELLRTVGASIRESLQRWRGGDQTGASGLRR
jgi:ubiquinone biosynthesis accessory factor UbiJ